ncbi:MAG: aldehyde dehydrogenase family protein, partial [Planctomycetota bacterium]
MEIVKVKRKPKKAARTKSSRPDTFRFDYVDSIENPDVVDIKPTQKLFINGKFVRPKSGKYIKTINPATGKVLSNVACANKADIDLAVKAARKAYDDVWSKMPGRQRARYIYRISRIFETRKKEFAVLETLDNGKPIKESRNVDIPLVAAHFFHTAGWADKLEYAVPGQKVKPVGVCGQIIPWNFPLMMAAWKIAPALAAGNTVVI